MAMIYDTSLFNIAMQQNKQAWEGIAEARQAAVKTTYGNLQAKVDKASAMSKMIGDLAGGLSPIAGNLGKQLGGSFFPSVGGGGGGGYDPQGLSMDPGPQGWTSGYGQKGWRDQSYNPGY